MTKSQKSYFYAACRPRCFFNTCFLLFVPKLLTFYVDPSSLTNLSICGIIKLMDNTGELGKGQVFRQSERENLYKAFDIGAWWLQAALSQ